MSLLKTIVTIPLGKIKCFETDTLFEAMYAVKNPIQMYKLDTTSVKNKYIQNVEKNKIALGQRYLKILRENHIKTLKRRKIQVITDETDPNDINHNFKLIYRKGIKWYAVVLFQQGGGDDDILEEAFVKHIMDNYESDVEKIKVLMNDHDTMVKWIESFKKTHKHLIELYEKELEENIKNKYLEEHKDEHNDKDIFESQHFKDWYSKIITGGTGDTDMSPNTPPLSPAQSCEDLVRLCESNPDDEQCKDMDYDRCIQSRPTTPVPNISPMTPPTPPTPPRYDVSRTLSCDSLSSLCPSNTMEYDEYKKQCEDVKFSNIFEEYTTYMVHKTFVDNYDDISIGIQTIEDCLDNIFSIRYDIPEEGTPVPEGEGTEQMNTSPEGTPVPQDDVNMNGGGLINFMRERLTRVIDRITGKNIEIINYTEKITKDTQEDTQEDTRKDDVILKDTNDTVYTIMTISKTKNQLNEDKKNINKDMNVILTRSKQKALYEQEELKRELCNSTEDAIKNEIMTRSKTAALEKENTLNTITDAKEVIDEINELNVNNDQGIMTRSKTAALQTTKLTEEDETKFVNNTLEKIGTNLDRIMTRSMTRSLENTGVPEELVGNASKIDVDEDVVTKSHYEERLKNIENTEDAIIDKLVDDINVDDILKNAFTSSSLVKEQTDDITKVLEEVLKNIQNLVKNSANTKKQGEQIEKKKLDKDLLKYTIKEIQKKLNNSEIRVSVRTLEKEIKDHETKIKQLEEEISNLEERTSVKRVGKRPRTSSDNISEKKQKTGKNQEQIQIQEQNKKQNKKLNQLRRSPRITALKLVKPLLEIQEAKNNIDDALVLHKTVDTLRRSPRLAALITQEEVMEDVSNNEFSIVDEDKEIIDETVQVLRRSPRLVALMDPTAVNSHMEKPPKLDDIVKVLRRSPRLATLMNTTIPEEPQIIKYDEVINEVKSFIPRRSPRLNPEKEIDIIKETIQEIQVLRRSPRLNKEDINIEEDINELKQSIKSILDHTQQEHMDTNSQDNENIIGETIGTLRRSPRIAALESSIDTNSNDNVEETINIVEETIDTLRRSPRIAALMQRHTEHIDNVIQEVRIAPDVKEIDDEVIEETIRVIRRSPRFATIQDSYTGVSNTGVSNTGVSNTGVSNTEFNQIKQNIEPRRSPRLAQLDEPKQKDIINKTIEVLRRSPRLVSKVEHLVETVNNLRRSPRIQQIELQKKIELESTLNEVITKAERVVDKVSNEVFYKKENDKLFKHTSTSSTSSSTSSASSSTSSASSSVSRTPTNIDKIIFNEDEGNAVVNKIYNDLHHDFNGTRGNEYKIANNAYTNNDFFKSKIKDGIIKKLNEDAYMYSIIENLDVEQYVNFFMDFRDTKENKKESSTANVSPEKDNRIINKLKEKYKDKKVYIIEDMSLSKIKEHVGIIPRNTYTNILDPITSVNKDGNTDKDNKLLYPHVLKKFQTTHPKYTKAINEIFTQFFKSMNSDTTWKIKTISFDHFIYKKNDNNKTKTFKIKFVFEGNIAPMFFDIYAGMFTVIRINYLIAYVKSKSLQKQIDDFYDGKSDNKAWSTIKALFRKLGTYIKDVDRRLLFIQLMKTIGDHSQLMEYRNIIYRHDKNEQVLFGTMDRIMIAETIRLNAPILFQLRSVKGKFTPEFPMDDRFLQGGTDLKTFYYTPYDGIATIDYSDILKQNGIIENGTINDNYEVTSLTFVNNNIKNFNHRIINNYNTDKDFKTFIRRLVMYNRYYQSYEELVNNISYTKLIQKSLELHLKEVITGIDTNTINNLASKRIKDNLMLMKLEIDKLKNTKVTTSLENDIRSSSFMSGDALLNEFIGTLKIVTKTEITQESLINDDLYQTTIDKLNELINK